LTPGAIDFVENLPTGFSPVIHKDGGFSYLGHGPEGWQNDAKGEKDMKTLIVSAVLWALGLCLVGPVMAADKQDLDKFDKRINDINAMTTKPAKADLAFQRISTETGMPVERLKQQHQRHPDIGLAGLFVANVLADETKKGPEVFLSQRASGKKWINIAKENKVSVEKLNERLDRLENAIKG
jgi:hypothetical protein